MGLASNQRFLFSLSLMLSLILHGLALSYMPIEHWELELRGPDTPERPLLHIKMSKFTERSQKFLTNATTTQKSENLTKHVIAPKEKSNIKKQSPRKLVTTAPKTMTKPLTKQSPATLSTFEPKTKSIQPKDIAMAAATANANDSLPIEETTIDSEVNISPATTAPPQMPDYLNNPKPFYPLAAKRRGMQGRVLLEVTVSASGAATKIMIKKSSGYKLLDRAASDTVASWQFIPASQNGQNIESIVEIPIHFELTQG